MNKLVILDRDGVINHDSDEYVKSTDEWIPIEGSPEAIARLTQAGFTVVVATNQSGIARGYFDVEVLDAMHVKMQTLVQKAGGQIDGIFYCPHGPEDGCDCRKPDPGLITQIENSLGLRASGAFIIGDSKRDLDAGLAKGCRPILVKTGKGQRTIDKGLDIQDLTICNDLRDAVDFILKESREN